MFAPESERVVYERDYWWSDKWDQFKSGRVYDFSRPFFEQFSELMKQAPLPNLANNHVIDSPYGNHNEDCKNCYLTYAVYGGENLHYTGDAAYARDSMDLHAVTKAEQCYDVVVSGNVSRLLFSYNSDESTDSAFLFDCKNVSNSLGCVNLKDKAYHIFNKPYLKDEYRQERARYDFGSYKNLQAFREKFQEFRKSFPRRYATILKSVNTTGNHIMNAKNSKHCFDIYNDIEDCKYLAHATTARDSYDAYGIGLNCELVYEATDCGIHISRNKFAIFAHENQNVEYIYGCFGSRNLFGCVGLRKAEYCILNKQYSKEEYEALVPKIKRHMDEMPYRGTNGRVYRYGEFFPSEISPFAYNETIAQEFFIRDRGFVEQRGLRWKDQEQKQHTGTVEPNNLPDHIKDVNDSILNEVIRCEHGGECAEQCPGAFRIIQDELTFYRRFNLPLPRLCPNCRHYSRRRQRDPFKLWARRCQCGGLKSENKVYANLATHPHGDLHCENEFETTIAPDRSDIVYCESCYQQEVV